MRTTSETRSGTTQSSRSSRTTRFVPESLGRWTLLADSIRSLRSLFCADTRVPLFPEPHRPSLSPSSACAAALCRRGKSSLGPINNLFSAPDALVHYCLQGYDSVYSTDSEEETERERIKKGALGKLARRRFTSCLRGMKGERGDIARCMTFSLEHADAADEVSHFILELESRCRDRRIAHSTCTSLISHRSPT